MQQNKTSDTVAGSCVIFTTLRKKEVLKMGLNEIKNRLKNAGHSRPVVGVVQAVNIQKTQTSLRIVIDAKDVDEITLNRGVVLKFR